MLNDMYTQLVLSNIKGQYSNSTANCQMIIDKNYFKVAIFTDLGKRYVAMVKWYYGTYTVAEL